jgi:hypothetical protein
MNHLFRIVRLSNVLKEQDAAHLEGVRNTIAKSRQLLNCIHPIDTFAGRKTQEPFPREDADMSAAEGASPKPLKPSE